MSSEPRSTGAHAAKKASAWRRFVAWMFALEEAMDASYDEVQDRRIFALELEVANLRSKASELTK